MNHVSHSSVAFDRSTRGTTSATSLHLRAHESRVLPELAVVTRILDVESGTVALQQDALTTILHVGQSQRIDPGVRATLLARDSDARVRVSELAGITPVSPEILTVLA